MRRGPRLSQNGEGPLAHAAEASVIPNRRRPPRPCGGTFCGPKAKEAPAPRQWGPQCSQNGGGPRVQAAGA